jgi:hypothetical protein
MEGAKKNPNVLTPMRPHLVPRTVAIGQVQSTLKIFGAYLLVGILYMGFLLDRTPYGNRKHLMGYTRNNNESSYLLVHL